MLTIQSGYRYTGSLKTITPAFTPRQRVFFMPMAWMRAENNRYQPKHCVIAFSESTPLLILRAFLRKITQMTNIISVYNFNNNKIRTQSVDGNPWFCLLDCCKALGIKNAATSVKLSEAGVGKTYCSYDSGKKEITIINEPNLYRLIFRSNKPQAQAFADWVYSEVLPSIRKTGGYTTASSPSSAKAAPSLSCSGLTGASTLRQELAALTSESATDADMQDMRNLIAALMNNIIDGRVKNQYRHLVDEIAALRAKLDTIRKTIA